MIRVLLRYFLVLTLGVFAFAPSFAQQSLTAKQIEILSSLPEGQRQELLERYMRGSSTSIDQPIVFPEVVTPRSESADADTVPSISGGETLVINFTLNEDIDAEVERQYRIDSNKVSLLGSNTYVLDSNGVLRLPGVANIPLTGLNQSEVKVRLGAEPALRDLAITVAMLPLEPAGVASLRRFGSQLFDGVPSTFAPATDVPVPVDYVVGPGDTIKLQLFGNENAEYSLVIGRDGTINIPDIGPLGTIGLTFAELRNELVSRISEQKIGVRASVTMGELRTIRVFVLGDVRTPGSFTVSGLSTMTNALFVSGGITDAGTMRDVQLKRSGKVIARIDLYDLLLRGDTSDDARLQPGDVIFVPPVGATVGVAGQVVRPAVYEARGEKTVGELVKMAGGLLPTAYRASGQLERIDAAGRRTILSIDLADGDDLLLPIQNGDAIYIDIVLDLLEDTIMLGGHVMRPGPFQWRPGIRLTDIVTSSAVLRGQADLGYLMVRRELPDTGEVEVLSGDIAEAWRNPRSEQNLLLQPRDEITVFELGPSRGAAVQNLMRELTAQARFGEPFQEAAVSGQVKAAGTYPLETGMRVTDLIRAGGGMSESAFIENAELTRFIIGEDGQRRSKLIYINLEQAMRGDLQDDLLLMPHDHLSVREIPQWRDKETVVLVGEVQFPGVYTIQREETLRSVINRAGGLTDRAFPEGAVFTRVALRERERNQIQVLADRLESDLSTIALQASREDDGALQALSVGQSLLSQLRNSEPVGRLVIDLGELASGSGDPSSDLLLRAGDQLLVPEATQEVTVIGEVQYPTSHMFDAGWDRDDYIESSGGVSIKADKKRIYVVRVDGSVEVQNGSKFFRRNSGIEIRPGDTVVVPLDAHSMSPIALWSDVTQIIFNLAVAVSAINSF